MKLCTCGNCGNVYRDLNPSDESKYYDSKVGDEFIIVDLAHLEENGETFLGCPVCQTDSYLQDNVNANCGGQAAIIQNCINNISH